MAFLTSQQYATLVARQLAARPASVRKGEDQRLRAKYSVKAVARRIEWEERMAKLPGVFVAVKTPNPVNGSHGCHWVTTNMRKKQHAATEDALADVERPVPPYVITFTRYSAGELDDDNLRPAFKAVRDSVARWLGVDDGRKGGVTWLYEQAPAPRGCFAVRIEFNRRDTGKE